MTSPKKKIFKGKSKLLNIKKTKTKTRTRTRGATKKNKLLPMNGNPKWNYEYEDILKCSTDETNEVNIYYITSFKPSNNKEFNETIENCYTLFDNNLYSILI